MQDYPKELQAVLLRCYGNLPSGIQLNKLKGDASTRSYYRLTFDSPMDSTLFRQRPTSLIVMQLPQGEIRSDEITGDTIPTEYPFVSVQRLLYQRGVRVPEIYLDALEQGILLLEDLGDETLELRLNRRGRSDWLDLYKSAVDLLIDLHQRCDPPDSSCIAYQRKYDTELFSWELDHFLEFGLEAVRGPLTDVQKETLREHFSRLVGEMENIPQGFVHRDFQSRNLMCSDHTEGVLLTIIDFQDALIGPKPYDMTALLCDSYIPLDVDLQEELLNYYISRRELSHIVASEYHRAFWLTALHRKLKDAGRFVFIDRVRNNPDFLPFYSQSLRYVGRALERLDSFQDLHQLLTQLLPGFADNVMEPVSIHASL